jgi:glutathione S-transferase
MPLTRPGTGRSIARMRLHYHPLSSYSRKAAIGIALRGDPVELHVLDVFAGELKSPSFLAMNPFGKMPVLETDDGPIFESTSILEYLEERGPRKLLPKGGEQRARHFDRLGDLYLLNPIGKYFWNKSDEALADARSSHQKAWSLWEKELADGRKFLAGDDITLGDLSAAVAAHYAETEGLELPSAIRAYRERLEANPIVRGSADAATPFIEASKPRRQPKAAASS